MSTARLALIRFATYAILIACVLLAKRQRYFIPLHLGPAEMDVNIFESGHRGGLPPSRMLGFADTRLSGSEVLHRAIEGRKSRQLDIPQFVDPEIGLILVNGNLVWLVSWNPRDSGASMTRLFIYVDDKTGATMSFEELRKLAEPGATDNPDDTQRLREDH